MNSETKVYEEKMNGVIHHLTKELAAIRAGRANPAVLDKITVDYYGAPTPINQVAAIAVSEARILTITPWDASLMRAIEKAILTSDVGINPTNDGRVTVSYTHLDVYKRQPLRRSRSTKFSHFANNLHFSAH